MNNRGAPIATGSTIVRAVKIRGHTRRRDEVDHATLEWHRLVGGLTGISLPREGVFELRRSEPG